eukprot:scaffold15825_cov85-Skeletonema_dohrnii-CCMP3373.AAC.1
MPTTTTTNHLLIPIPIRVWIQIQQRILLHLLHVRTDRILLLRMGIVGGRFLLLLEVVIRVEMDAKSSSSSAVAVVAVRRLGGGGHEEANNNNCWVEDGCGCLGVKRWAAVDDIIIMLVELVFVDIECVLYS